MIGLHAQNSCIKDASFPVSITSLLLIETIAAARNRPIIINRVRNHGFPSFLLDYFPMPALVGTDTANDSQNLKLLHVFIDMNK